MMHYYFGPFSDIVINAVDYIRHLENGSRISILKALESANSQLDEWCCQKDMLERICQQIKDYIDDLGITCDFIEGKPINPYEGEFIKGTSTIKKIVINSGAPFHLPEDYEPIGERLTINANGKVYYSQELTIDYLEGREGLKVKKRCFIGEEKADRLFTSIQQVIDEGELMDFAKVVFDSGDPTMTVFWSNGKSFDIERPYGLKTADDGIRLGQLIYQMIPIEGNRI